MSLPKEKVEELTQRPRTLIGGIRVMGFLIYPETVFHHDTYVHQILTSPQLKLDLILMFKKKVFSFPLSHILHSLENLQVHTNMLS